MSIFRNVVFIAAIAGLLASLVMAAMQSFSTDPLILKAETYENAAEPAHDHGAPAADATAPAASEPAPAPSKAAPAAAAHDHEHDEEAWAPADGFERFAFNFLANIISGFGFALILVAV